MSSDFKPKKVLVLGGTGPSGLCLLRELLHRSHSTILYARNPSKVPADLSAHPLLEIVQGEITPQAAALSSVTARTSVIVSLLGAQLSDRGLDPDLYAGMYRETIFPLMRQHGVQRILAISTISVKTPEDSFSAFHTFVRWFMWIVAGNVYASVINVAETFVKHGQGIDWILLRLAQIPGEADEEDWRRDREDGDVFAGWIAQPGWTKSIKRARLSRWIVDAIEGGAEDWRGKMPAISAKG